MQNIVSITKDSRKKCDKINKFYICCKFLSYSINTFAILRKYTNYLYEVFYCKILQVLLNLVKKMQLAKRSGTLNGKMLHLRIIENDKIDPLF